jgi:hypothetical protein
MVKVTRNKISKIDYFVGVFVSAILNCARNVPALMEETSDSKKVQFETDNGKYKVYVKYSKTMKVGKNKTRYWFIPFSKRDYDRLCDFSKDNNDYKNYIAVICANSTLTTTWIGVLDYDNVIKFFGNNSTGEGVIIKVLREGNNHELSYGISGDDENNFHKCYYDFTRYFR